MSVVEREPCNDGYCLPRTDLPFATDLILQATQTRQFTLDRSVISYLHNVRMQRVITAWVDVRIRKAVGRIAPADAFAEKRRRTFLRRQAPSITTSFRRRLLLSPHSPTCVRAGAVHIPLTHVGIFGFPEVTSQALKQIWSASFNP
jgi:hypothetical protein